MQSYNSNPHTVQKPFAAGCSLSHTGQNSSFEVEAEVVKRGIRSYELKLFNWDSVGAELEEIGLDFIPPNSDPHLS